MEKAQSRYCSESYRLRGGDSYRNLTENLAIAFIAKSAGESSGLGLQIVKKIIENYQEHISV